MVIGGKELNLGYIKNLIELGRFRFLVGGFLLYIMGYLLAVISKNSFSIELFIFGYAIMFPAHLSLSYSNNYFDVNVDKYNEPISISGGSKTLIKHPELKNTCKYFAISLIFISIFLAVIFVLLYYYSIMFLFFIIFGNLLGWFYSAPPLRLAYRGFGEIANMINMGCLMPGIGYWVMNGGFDLFFLVFVFPLFVYGLFFIITVETPDKDGDFKGGKNTFVVKKGLIYSYYVALACLTVSSLYFLIISLSGFFKELIDFTLVFLFSLIPLSISIIGLIKKPFTKKIATKVAKINIYTISLYLFIFDIFLFFKIINI